MQLLRFPDVILVELNRHSDPRGSFARTFCTATFARAGLPFNVVQASVSRNWIPHTLRGMHLQEPPHGESKLVYCTHGRIWDVAVDLRPDSPTFRRWQGFELGGENDAILHLPKGIAHGFLTLEPGCESTTSWTPSSCRRRPGASASTIQRSGSRGPPGRP